MGEGAQVLQAEMAVVRETRTKLQCYACGIGIMDGKNKEELRTWIRKIDHAKRWTGASETLLLEMVATC